MPRKKFPLKPLGIDPGTFRLVAQCLNPRPFKSLSTLIKSPHMMCYFLIFVHKGILLLSNRNIWKRYVTEKLVREERIDCRLEFLYCASKPSYLQVEESCRWESFNRSGNFLPAMEFWHSLSCSRQSDMYSYPEPNESSSKPGVLFP
jgi:hypothetical protein